MNVREKVALHMALLPLPPLPMLASRSLAHEARVSGDTAVANSHDIIARIFTKTLSEHGSSSKYMAIMKILHEVDTDVSERVESGATATAIFEALCMHTRRFISESTKLLCGVNCTDVRFMDYGWTCVHFKDSIKMSSINHLNGLARITEATHEISHTEHEEYPVFISRFARVVSRLASPVERDEVH